MSFGQPTWLLALLLLPALSGLYWRGQMRAKARLTGLLAPRLRERLISGVQPGRRVLRFALFLFGIACGILALAQPRYGFADQNIPRLGRDVLIAVDTSKSMLANDTAPDRLTRARLAALDLLDALPGDRAGLLAFAGLAFLQAPLTIDYSAVRESLDVLDTSVIPQGGTNISAAVRAALDAFGKSESNNRCLVIFSDGEDLTEDAVAAARGLAGKVRIFTVGVGTAEGALLPISGENGGTDFIKDQDGNFVKSRLDETRLRQIAEATGGFYLHLGESRADMQRLVRDGIVSIEEGKINARLARQPIERFQWPLGAALLLLALWHLIPEGRARPMISRVKVAALFIALLNTVSHAEDPMNLYRDGKYQDAYQAFQEHLAKRPNSPELQFNSGDSAFQAQQYQKAIEAFSGALAAGAQLGTKSEYNLGSALFQRGLGQKEVETKKKDWKNALQHLDSVLKTEPQNADAKFNRDAIQKALDDLDRQQEEQKKQDEQKKDDEKKSGKQDKKDQQKSGGQQDQKDQSKQQDEKNGQPEDQQKGKNGDQKSEAKPQPGGSPSPSPTPGKGDEAQSQPGQSPSPTPAREGAIQAATPGPSPEGSPAAGQSGSGAAEAAPAGSPTPGEMTPQQAAMLLDSLKGDEKNVPLNEHRPTGPVLKDW